MRMSRIASLVIFLACLGAVCGICRAAPLPGAGPSFSCAAPSLSPTERQICGNAELAGYDRELAGLYEAKIQSASSSEEKTQLLQSQRAWLQKRNACGDGLDCIKGAYLTKIYDLQTSTASVAGADLAGQVNAAIPLSSRAQAALTEARHRVRDKAVLAGIESQLRLKMQLRALTCIQSLGIGAGLSSQQLHDRYGGDPCFAKQDDDIAGWLGIRTVGYVLTLPALRPLPAAAPQSITDSVAPIKHVFFAAQAGVALVESQKDTEVIDLARGTPISSQFSPGGPLAAISPNGRVYIAHDYSSPGRLRFYDSEDGALLADPSWYEYAGICGYPWLDQQTTLTMDLGAQSPSIYDLGSGAIVLSDELSRLFCVTPLPGAGAMFVGFGASGIIEFKLAHGPDGKLHAEVTQSKQLKPKLVASDNTGLLPGGRQYVNVSDKQLAITDLSDLGTELVDFGRNFEVQQVMPTPDPDKIIVGGTRYNATWVSGPTKREWQFYAYTLKEQTLSLLAVEPDLLGVQVGTEFYYDSPQNTLYVMKDAGRDATLTRVDTLSGDTPVPLATFLAETNQPGSSQQPHRRPDLNSLSPGTMAVTMQNGRMNKVYTGAYPQPGSTSPTPSDVTTLPAGTVAMTTVGGEITGTSTQSVPGNISQLAQNADVEGIGIVDSGMTDSGSLDTPAVASSNPSEAKVVHVTIRGRRNPLVLVLSSRSVVQWQLDVASGAHLAAVLISGANGSSVQGEGDVPVSVIGSAYSYAMGSPGYPELQNEVFSTTGKRMKLIQAGGPDTHFVVY